MDHNDREQFWKTLCSLPGNDIVAEREQLFKSIKYPKLLFRYRPVSTKSLEALRTNKLYFSSANYYDDPFDTFLHIDIEAIRKEYLSAFQTPESTEAVVDGVKSLLGNILSEEQAAQFTVENVTNALSHGLTESFLNAALSLRDEVKKDTWSVCFSENGFNEVLWLKYADQHRGFVQIYDLENNDNFLCGKQESLYIANFLGENEAQAQQIFKQVRKIYSSRSSAVHGNKTKDNLESAVEESANLLTRILRRCAELNKLPDVDNLAFRVDKQKQGIKCKILVP